jgi:hypothetical protein
MTAPRRDPQFSGTVAVDAKSIAAEGSGYRVRLTGPFDAGWIRAYVSAWTGSTFFSRFDLDVEKQTAWFSLEEQDSEKDVASILHVLDAMLRLTSRRADGTSKPGLATPGAPRYRNRLAPSAELALQLPIPAPPPARREARCEEPIEDLMDEDVDSLVAEDLIEI